MYEVLEEKKLKGSKIKLKVKVDKSVVDELFKEKVKELKNDLQLKGFRKGKVPDDLVIEHFGEEYIKTLAAEKIIQKIHSKYLKDKGFDAIGSPEIEDFNYESDGSLVYQLSFYYIPEIKLPDYKNIAKSILSKKKEIKVTQKDLENAILHLRRQVALKKKLDEIGEKISPEEFQKIEKEIFDLPKSKLPKLKDNLEFFGNYKNEKELIKKIEEEILKNKQIQEEEKTKVEILEKIAKNTKFDVPEILVDFEAANELNSLQAQLAQNNISLQDYLKQIKKTDKQLSKEIREKAEKTVQLQLIINEIAKKEKISPNPKEVQEEVQKIMSYYKDVDITSVYNYVFSQKLNQKVIDFLMSSDKKTNKTKSSKSNSKKENKKTAKK